MGFNDTLGKLDACDWNSSGTGEQNGMRACEQVAHHPPTNEEIHKQNKKQDGRARDRDQRNTNARTMMWKKAQACRRTILALGGRVPKWRYNHFPSKNSNNLKL